MMSPDPVQSQSIGSSVMASSVCEIMWIHQLLYKWALKLQYQQNFGVITKLSYTYHLTMYFMSGLSKLR